MNSAAGKLVVLLPVFDDWEVLALLLRDLDVELDSKNLRPSVLVVNDGSKIQPSFVNLQFRSIRELQILHLRRNVGHQRAIAIGLAYLEANSDTDSVIVMDCDGEDTPGDAIRLLGRSLEVGDNKVVFALRGARSEGLTFRICYASYRWLFRVLTGRKIRFGNFSVVPRKALRQLVAVSEIWNHYAAGVQKASLPSEYVSTRRGKRLAGHSSMNFVSLITHGMSAISVHAEIVGSRMLVASAIFAVIIGSAMIAVVGIKLLTSLAIPGWATFVLGLLALMLAQTFFVALFFASTIMHGRNGYSFLPSRDHAPFVDNLQKVEISHGE